MDATTSIQTEEDQTLALILEGGDEDGAAQEDDIENIFVVEAAKQPIRLSKYFRTESLVNELFDDDEVCDEDGEATSE